MDMVEKVARAIWRDYWDGDALAWDEIDEGARQTSLSMARAAIEAMRDISISEKAPGVTAYAKDAGFCRPRALRFAWEAIIDAALNTKGGER